MVQVGWRPTVDNYLGRVTKSRILEAVREAKGECLMQLIDHLKKSEMAKEAERLLEGTGWLPEPLRLAEVAPRRRSKMAKQSTAGVSLRRRGARARSARSSRHRPSLPNNSCCGAAEPLRSLHRAHAVSSLHEENGRERQSRAGKGLSCRGLKRAPGGSAQSRSPRNPPMTESLIDGAAVPLPIRATAIVASAVVKAARQLLTDLERGRRVDAAVLRNAMEAAFAASDATGAWNWKTAYDACEAATVLFLRRYGAAMRAKAASPAAMLPMLLRIASLLPTQTRRSEESESLQQFSTPIGLAYVASVAAAITPADVVLEPSAGTGLLAILAELAGASLILNEFAESRAGILTRPFSRGLHDQV